MLFILLLFISFVSQSLSTSLCNSTTHFDCSTDIDKNLSCIPLEWLCDNVMDCPNGKDEQSCHYLHECPLSTMMCRDGECIDQKFKCDGTSDCIHGTDERGCHEGDTSHLRRMSSKPAALVSNDDSDEHGNLIDWLHQDECLSPKYQCLNGGPCIVQDAICDGEEDCTMGDDEMNCTAIWAATIHEEIKETSDGKTKPIGNTCGAKRMMCHNRLSCVPTDWVCDGHEDCEDGSDEATCTDVQELDHFLDSQSNFVLCDFWQHRCIGSTGKCIDRNRTCDRIADCPQGDDEGPRCNECNTKGCDHECTNTPQGAKCSCHRGSILSSDGTTCHDVDECQTEGKHCQHYCENRRGSYACSCAPGYSISLDGHSCRLDKSQEGMLFLSLGSEIRSMPLFDAQTSHDGYTIIQQVGSHDTVRSVSYLANNNKLYMAIDRSREEGELAVSDNGLVRVLRQNLPGIGQVAVDWVGGNLFITQRYAAPRPGISICSLNGFFCRQIIEGQLSDESDASKRQSYRGLALHPLRGAMVWIDSYNGRHKIMMANMDGTNIRTLVDNKLEYPTGISIDLITSDVYFGDAEKTMIEKVNMDTKERSIVVTGGVHHPFDIAYFNGFLFWSDWGTETLKVSELSQHHSSPHVIHSFHSFPLGISINHTMYQPQPIDRKCSSISCPWMCVSLPSPSGLQEAHCICPDDYDSLESGGCVPRVNKTIPEAHKSHIGVALMKEYCDENIACKNGGQCEDLKNTHGRVVRIECRCVSPYDGNHCERENLSLPLESDVSSGAGRFFFFLVLFLSVFVIALYFAYKHSVTISVVSKAIISELAQVSPSLPNIRPMVDTIKNKMPTLPTSIPRSARTDVARGDVENPLYGDSAQTTSPTLTRNSSVRSGSVSNFNNPLYNENSIHASPIGFDVTYQNKFVH